jgi:hypothetical protein
MKNLVKTFLIIFLLTSAVRADTHTSNGTGGGVFSAGATWVGASAPVDTDAFVIAAGDTVTFDMDQTLWAGMAASTINATGTLIWSTGAGPYYLKMNGDLTNNGTIQIGTSVAVPYPFAIKATIDFAAGSNSIVNHATTGHCYFYCTEPTNKYVKATEALAIGEGAAADPISVDTNVTTDIWAAGDTIHIDDIDAAVGVDTQRSVIDAGGIAAAAITVTAGTVMDSAALTGTKLILCTRNIKIFNSTDYLIKNGTGHYIAAWLSGTQALSAVNTSTIAGVIDVTGAGSVCTGCYGCTFEGPIAGGTYGVIAGYGNTFSDTCLISGATAAGVYQGQADVFETGCDISGCSSGLTYEMGSSINASFTSCSIGLNLCAGCSVTGAFVNTLYPFSRCTDIILGSITTSGSTADFLRCGNIKAYNCTLAGTTEFSEYNGAYRTSANYAESFDHDGSVNAYKAWPKGGIVTSQTTSPPTGYTIYYDHEVEVATYPCFRQYQATVFPGTAIEVSAVIRNTDGIDVSSTSPIDLRPRLEIIDVFADPLVNSTQTALDSDAIAVSNGTNTDWQDVDVIWANTGDAPRQVYVRIICYSHDASIHTIDEAWIVADYQDQINDIYTTVITNAAGVDIAADIIALKAETVSIKAKTDLISTDIVTANPAYMHNPLIDQADIVVVQVGLVRNKPSAAAIQIVEITTPGLIKVWRYRKGTDAGWTIIVNGGGMGAGIGSIYYTYTFPSASWADGDLILYEVYNTVVTLGTEVFTLSTVQGFGIIGDTASVAAILEDTSAYDTDAEHATAIWNAATASYGGAGTYGQAVEDVLADTTAYDTDAEHAAAIWNALMATYTTEASFGGEVQQLDPNITLIKYKTDLITILDTSIEDANDANNFTLSAGIDVNEALGFNIIMVTDATDAHSEVRYVYDYYIDEDSDPNVTVDEPFGFTPAAKDVVHIMGTGYGGFLYEMWNYLRSARAPVYIFDSTGGTSPGSGGVTHYTSTGDDP